MDYGHNEKKVVFYETDKRHADLKVRLRYDGLTQQKFFNSIITGYLEQQEEIVKFIAKLKDQSGIHSKAKRAKSKRMYERRSSTIDKFALNSDEIESIFDMIEKEKEDL